ncbi:hypothetical protein DYB32_008321 [Aphanomyces invadans]|uniref:Uncharacterized protein n=1 Tax=Aphanomyces invadans TaxID=157072 RepID=A0A418ALC0_9STRA|nr:hypothetical protein DYB32_008321 [Aphanomyces invadans]
MLQLYQASVVSDGMPDLIEAAKRDVRDKLQVAVIQTLLNSNNTMALSRVNILDPVEANYELWGWLFLLDWVDGKREVIQLEGEIGSITTISGSLVFQTTPTNTLEVPLNVAYYIRTAIQYVTIVLLLVACIVVGYIVIMRGYIEFWNMIEFNRVAGMVWIGRPLVFLRGITAICLLSTSKLDMVLSSNSVVTHMVSPPRFWVTTFMSCGEMTWLVYIINDVFSPLTKQFTYSYSYKSSNLVWLTTFVWSMVSPPEHSITINRECSIDIVDFQLVCRSGVLEIGSVTRFGGLIGLAFGCCLLCYVLERVMYPRLQFRLSTHSLMLHAAARNNFEFDRWTHRHVNYMDKASAVLNGLLSVQVGHVIHIFDVKSWRHYNIDVSIESHHALKDKEGALQDHLDRAIPLVE